MSLQALSLYLDFLMVNMPNNDPRCTEFYSLYFVLNHVYYVLHLTHVNMIILSLFAGTKCCIFVHF